MSRGAVISLGVLGAIVLVVLAVIGSAVSFNNTAISKENQLEAQYKQDQNVYDNFTKTIVETAQVPQQYTADIAKVFKEAIGSRYGAEGSKALFQMLKEDNPKFDSSMYTKVQQVIEAGHAKFENNQKILLDQKQVYLTYIQTFPNSIFAGMFHFPRMDLSKIDIVTSDSTEKAFATKKAEPLNVFGKQ